MSMFVIHSFIAVAGAKRYGLMHLEAGARHHDISEGLAVNSY